MEKLNIVSERREIVPDNIALIDFIINMDSEADKYVYVLNKACIADIILDDRKEKVIERFEDGQIMITWKGTQNTIMWAKEIDQSQQYVIFDMTLRGKKYKIDLRKAKAIYLGR